MKKYIIMFSVILTVFWSCDVQLDEVFDDTAASRVDKQVSEAYEILTAASNGWIMEYYPNTDQAYGGVNILVKFNSDNSVVMINETASDLNATQTSTYVINRSQSAVLAFDTFNEYICHYADPSVEEGEGRRYGYMGDLDFAIMSMNESEIVLRGTKTQNTILMRAIPQTITWADFLSNVQKIQSQKYNQGVVKFVFNYGDHAIDWYDDVDYPLFSYDYIDEDGLEKTRVISYMYTETGIKFYEPLEIFGLTLQYFDWNNEEVRFYCTDPGAETVYLQGEQEPYYRPYEYFLGDWFFYCTNGGWNVTITEEEYGKTMKITGMQYNSSTYGLFDYPITLTWRRSGLVEILCPQVIGKRDINYQGSTHTHGWYYDVDVVIRSTSASASSSTVGAGMISKTELHENPDRVDFENNGLNAAGTGIGLFFVINGVNSTLVRWLEPMYMVKQESQN